MAPPEVCRTLPPGRVYLGTGAGACKEKLRSTAAARGRAKCPRQPGAMARGDRMRWRADDAAGCCLQRTTAGAPISGGDCCQCAARVSAAKHDRAGGSRVDTPRAALHTPIGCPANENGPEDRPVAAYLTRRWHSGLVLAARHV